MKATDQINTLVDLVGDYPNAVCFVEDYVELHFNGPIFRCYIGPEIRLGERTTTFPDPGSRDALCSLIRDIVKSISVEGDKQISIAFASGTLLTVPLGGIIASVSEAAHFCIPGRAVFEVY